MRRSRYYTPKPYLRLHPDEPSWCQQCREKARLQRAFRAAEYDASCEAADANLVRKDEARTAYESYEEPCTCKSTPS